MGKRTSSPRDLRSSRSTEVLPKPTASPASKLGAQNATTEKSRIRTPKASELSNNGQENKVNDAVKKKDISSESEQESKKKKKVDTDEIYDSSRNVFSAVVLKAKRAISKLHNEEHVLSTLTAEQNPSEQKVKQTHEIQRCLEAVALAKQKIVDCLKTCEEAQGHRQVPQEHFTEEEELPIEHIRCWACENGDSPEGNDILLCDGERCNRCYHVECVPFRQDLDVEALLEDEDAGWLCPACDAKCDILWHLAETQDMEYDKLQVTLPDKVFGEESAGRSGEKRGATTILNIEMPSSDDDDSDFGGSSDDGEDDDGEGANAKERARTAQGEETVADDDVQQNTAGEPAASEDAEEEESDSDDVYEDDDDASLDAPDGCGDDGAGPSWHLGSSSGAVVDEEPAEVLAGKRRRSRVDYAVLNSYLFGGEQDEDHEDAEYAAEAYMEDSDDDESRRSKKRKKRPGAAVKK